MSPNRSITNHDYISVNLITHWRQRRTSNSR